jgi:Rieske Fe-S protein
MQRENPWTELYDPSRKTASAVIDFVEENVNVAAQYADLVTPGEVDSIDDIANGDGRIVRTGLSKAAVYRDNDGVIHSLSAVCPHLGCIVAWNSAEKTWDCPCHGSRYDRLGEVINGPANTALQPADSSL